MKICPSSKDNIAFVFYSYVCILGFLFAFVFDKAYISVLVVLPATSIFLLVLFWEYIFEPNNYTFGEGKLYFKEDKDDDWVYFADASKIKFQRKGE